MLRIRFKFAMENYGEEKWQERNQVRGLHRFYKNDAESNKNLTVFFKPACKCAGRNSFSFLEYRAKRIAV